MRAQMIGLRKRERELTLADFPGMASVCLSHSMAYERYGDLSWREGGTDQCICERVTDAVLRLRAEIAWARQDEANARERAEALERELREIERR